MPVIASKGTMNCKVPMLSEILHEEESVDASLDHTMIGTRARAAALTTALIVVITC